MEGQQSEDIAITSGMKYGGVYCCAGDQVRLPSSSRLLSDHRRRSRLFLRERPRDAHLCPELPERPLLRPRRAQEVPLALLPIRRAAQEGPQGDHVRLHPLAA